MNVVYCILKNALQKLINISVPHAANVIKIKRPVTLLIRKGGTRFLVLETLYTLALIMKHKLLLISKRIH